MPNFVALITSRLAGPILGAIALLSIIGNVTLGASLYFEKGSNAKLQTRVERLAGDNATLKNSNAVLKGSIAVQNAGVASLQTAAELAAASAKLGQAAHETAAAAHDAKAAALDNAKPAPGADQCAAASALITNTLAGEHAK